jgi:P27 family predicted phage terminase small subunit
MATKGRKPKPYLLKASEGNRGHRKLKPPPVAPAGQFEPPFPLEGIARGEWDRILLEAPWLRASEAMALADRCLCFQRMMEAEQDIAKRGMVVRTRNGKVKNPSVQIARGYRLSVQKHDVELGLTWAARSRGGAEGDSFAAVDALEDKLCG